MADLSKFVVTNREGDDSFVPDPIPEPTPDPTPSLEPSPDPDPAPSPEPTPPVPVSDFPSERFEGKYKSWEEVSEALNKPIPEAPKYDEPLQKVIDKYLADGDLTEYFKAHSVDYDKMSDEELVRRDFFAKNSDLSEKAANKLWEKELAKYKLDPEEHDEDDIEIATAMMKREASKLRESGKEAQKAYLVPSRQVAVKPSVEDLAKTVHAMPEAQSMKSSKSISFKSGDSVINYGVNDVDGALNLMADEDAFGSLFLENGRPNVDKWVRMVEFVRNEDAIIKTIYDQGLAAGQKIIENEIRNPDLHTQKPDKFNGSTIKERFISTLAQQQGLTN